MLGYKKKKKKKKKSFVFFLFDFKGESSVSKTELLCSDGGGKKGVFFFLPFSFLSSLNFFFRFFSPKKKSRPISQLRESIFYIYFFFFTFLITLSSVGLNICLFVFVQLSFFSSWVVAWREKVVFPLFFFSCVCKRTMFDPTSVEIKRE